MDDSGAGGLRMGFSRANVATKREIAERFGL